LNFDVQAIVDFTAFPHLAKMLREFTQISDHLPTNIIHYFALHWIAVLVGTSDA